MALKKVTVQKDGDTGLTSGDKQGDAQVTGQPWSWKLRNRPGETSLIPACFSVAYLTFFPLFLRIYCAGSQLKKQEACLQISNSSDV